jgi:hypothetical protein
VQDEVGWGHRLFYKGDITDIALVDFDLVFDVSDICGRSGGHIVEDRYLVAFFEQGVTEVRTDKSGSTGDENAHEVKSIGKAGAGLKSAQGFGFLWLMSEGRAILKI